MPLIEFINKKDFPQYFVDRRKGAKRKYNYEQIDRDLLSLARDTRESKALLVEPLEGESMTGLITLYNSRAKSLELRIRIHRHEGRFFITMREEGKTSVPEV